MKPVRVAFLAGIVALASCAPRSPAPPPPRPQPIEPARPVPPPPPPAAADWRDIPLSRGTWFYSNQGGTSQALFGAPNSEGIFIVRCDPARRQVSLWREGTTSGNMMTVRTSFGARNFPLSVQAEPLPYVHTALPATDRFLDNMAFSRGRFTVEVPGTPMLVLPAWAEPARVIEDCRG
jgi:hypothetical protein